MKKVVAEMRRHHYILSISEAILITTALTGGVVSSDFDSYLISAVRAKSVKNPSMAERHFLVAVGNQYGEIYRLIGADTKGELESLLSILESCSWNVVATEFPLTVSKYYAVIFQPKDVDAVARRKEMAKKYKRQPA